MNRRNQVSNEDRGRLVDCFEAGEDWIELARRLRINKETARSIITVWVQDGRVEKRERGGALNRKMDDEMKDVLIQIIDSSPFDTLQSCNNKLRQRLPNKPQVSIATIARALEGALITTKIAGKDSDIPQQRNTPANIARRLEYAQFFTQLGVNDNLIYLDESGYNLFTRRTKGRARQGERVRRQVAGSRGRNVNFTVSISPVLGVVHHHLGQITVTRETFQRFLNELIEAAAVLIPDNERCIIIFDGARPHLRMAVPEDHAHRFQLRILPPYSPMLNPTEQAHSCFKQAVKNKLANPAIQNELQDAGNLRQQEGLTLNDWRARILIRLGRQSMDEITVQKCQNWCGRVHRFIPGCLQGQPILD